MTLKTRIKKLELSTKTDKDDKDTCIFIVGAYPKEQIKPPVIGYKHENDIYMRLPNENDEELKNRVSDLALEKTIRQECGVKVALVFEVLDETTEFAS